MTTLVLTDRDMEMFDLLALHRECLLEDIALLWAKNPYTGTTNRTPAKQCARRLAELRAHGYIELARIKDGRRTRTVVYLARRADQPLDERASRRTIGTKERVHHLRSLDALRLVEKRVAARGGRVKSFKVEALLRSEAQHGRRTRRGDFFASFPDALCIAVVPFHGGEREIKIAVEYVTSKYTSADIGEKHRSFKTEYDEAVWFADKRRTAERVTAITGGPCSILS